MHAKAVKLTTDIRAALVRASRATSSALNVFTTIGDMPSLPAVGSAAHSALRTDIERIISQGSNRRFTKMIEVIYAEATRQSRDRFFIVMVTTAIIFYNLFLIADWLLIPDQFWLFLVLQIGVVTPLTIAMVILVIYDKLDCDVTSMLILFAMLAATLVGLRAIDSKYAMLIGSAINLLIISSNLFVAIPFTWAAVYTMLSNIIIAAVLFSHPAIETSAAVFVIVTNLGASMYSIVGHYRIDAGVRGAFLFTLLERLRADQLMISNRQLDALVGIDGLTGIGNRRAFDRTMNDLCGRRGVGLVLIDIDHFKLLNDRHGHLVGDACLRQVASLLVDRMPNSDHVPARYGGEEFAIIISDGDTQTTFAVAEDIRLAIGNTALITDEAGEVIRVTVSIGCAALPADAVASPVGLISAADGALYDAKRSGRNRTRMGQVVSPTSDPAAATGTIVCNAA